MKKCLFFGLFIVISANCFSQITLEHTYSHEIQVARISESKVVYYTLDADNNTLDIFTSNHIHEKTVTIPIPAGKTYNRVYYLSKTLFNSDDKYEFLVEFGNGFGFMVCNEDGDQLLLLDDGLARVEHPDFANRNGAVYNTPNGAKLAVFADNGSYTKIYSLPGQLISKNNLDKSFNNLPAPFPNPTTDLITLSYSLPKGETEGKIVIYSLKGDFIKQIKVSNNFDHILLNVEDFKSGVYCYNLITHKETVKGQKFLVF
jgi:hypothetical protein